MYTMTLKEKIISIISNIPFLEKWLESTQKEGFDCEAGHKLTLFFTYTFLVLLLGLSALAGRLDGNLAYLAEWGRVSGLVPTRYHTSLPPIFAVIAKCESGGSHYDEQGRVARGRINRHDVGLYQINEVIHKIAIKKMGLDIYTPSGNTAFATYLYQKSGLEPWRPSRPCWRKYL